MVLIFLLLSKNNLVSYFYSNEKDKYMNKINNWKNKFNKIINTLELSPACSNLLSKIFDFNQFIQTLTNKQRNNNNLTQPQFENLMYAFKFVLKSS